MSVCRVRIVDPNAELIEAFNATISETVDIECSVGEALDRQSGALICPGNSWALMDGGFSAAVAFKWPHVPGAILEEAKRLPFEEISVGRAVTVPTNDPGLPHLIYAPTVRAPGLVLDPTLVLLAVRSAVTVALALGCSDVVMPGMGTGAGKMPPDVAAAAIVGGCQAARFPQGRPASLHEAVSRHYGLNG